ncbi:MAG: segregation/condensation protein A [Deltaproteobacteria bacterium]|nr:segregation/condensation protein A [Deltaproteobacteria bacterium]
MRSVFGERVTRGVGRYFGMRQTHTDETEEAQPGEISLELNRNPYTITLPCFEGPLHTLLSMIREHKLDIFDIPMAFIVEKYLEYLDVMRQLNLDVASEYLTMAATLVHIKSRLMLPVPEAGEEDEEADPRDELVTKLLTYQQFKDASAELAKRPQIGRDLFVRASRELLEHDAGEVPLLEVSIYALVKAFMAVQRRIRSDITQEITAERVTIAQRIYELVDQLRDRPEMRFLELLQAGCDRREMIITFLAVLEMAKLRLVRIFQVERDGEIYVRTMIEPAEFEMRRSEIARIEYR